MNLATKKKQTHRHREQTFPRGQGWREERFGSSKCEFLYIGWINNKVLLYSTGDCIQYPIINHNGKKVSVSSGLPWGWGFWQQQSWDVPLGHKPSSSSPLTLLQSLRQGSPQTKRLTGREHRSTHQQTIGLKFY